MRFGVLAAVAVFAFGAGEARAADWVSFVFSGYLNDNYVSYYGSGQPETGDPRYYFKYEVSVDLSPADYPGSSFDGTGAGEAIGQDDISLNISNGLLVLNITGGGYISADAPVNITANVNPAFKTLSQVQSGNISGSFFDLWYNPLETDIYYGDVEYLTVSDSPGPSYGLSELISVLEPATWALLLTGFGMIGAALRRRPRVNFQTQSAG